MDSENEMHLSWRLNIQGCELLQVLQEAAIKRCFESVLWSVLGILKQ